MDPGLEFWLRYVDDRGGLVEPAADGTLVMLPPAVAGEFDLPDELVVTADPDVARDGGMVLLATGHPALIRAADATLTAGDAGVVALVAPTTPAPNREQLQAKVRDQVPVQHGRIDVTGLPVRIDRPMLRVGALVTYTVSAEEFYQERLECWVDAVSGLQLAADDVTRLQRAPRPEGPVTAPRPVLAAVTGGVGAGPPHPRRRRRPAAQHPVGPGFGRPPARTRTRPRLLRRCAAVAGAPPGLRRPRRAKLLAARTVSTRAERARRLLEIDEKYQARHEIHPFRLHAVLVPGWRVPVDIRRGPRRYPFAFDWLAALGAFAHERCPHCGAAASLSASKARLGCLTCLPGTTLHAVPAPA